MMAAAILYTLLASALFTVAALLGERSLAQLGRACRWIWAAALVASVALPAATLGLRAESEPVVAVVRDTPAPLALQASGSPYQRLVHITGPSVPDPPLLLGAISWPVTRALDAPLLMVWPVLSASLVVIGCVAWMRLRRRARGWEPTTLDDEPVFVAPDTGPAVFGFFRPQIVVPRWLLERPLLTRALVLEHELEHIRARDPLLLLLALVLVALMPWNLPLWWQLRRLRLAMEIDCDARVLSSGIDPSAYGATLLDMRMQPSRALVSAMSMTQPASQLERRISIMMSTAARRGAWAGLFGTALATSLVVAATTMDTPVLRPEPRIVYLAPLPVTPYEQIEATVRARYAWLYDRAFSGTALVRVVLNPSGWIDRQGFERVGSTLREDEVDRSPERFRTALGLRPDEIATTGIRRPSAGNEFANNIFIVFAVKKEGSDPSSSTALVQTAVRERYPELFEPTPDILLSYVRVLMNSDGTIARARRQVLMETGADGAPHRTGETLRPAFNQPARFADLGVQAEDIESTGTISLVIDPVPAKRVGIDYAWLKRGAVVAEATSAAGARSFN
jgi:hypothetical protein